MAMAYCGKNRETATPGMEKLVFAQKLALYRQILQKVSFKYLKRDVSLEIDTSWLVFEILYDI